MSVLVHFEPSPVGQPSQPQRGTHPRSNINPWRSFIYLSLTEKSWPRSYFVLARMLDESRDREIVLPFSREPLRVHPALKAQGRRASEEGPPALRPSRPLDVTDLPIWLLHPLVASGTCRQPGSRRRTQLGLSGSPVKEIEHAKHRRVIGTRRNRVPKMLAVQERLRR